MGGEENKTNEKKSEVKLSEQKVPAKPKYSVEEVIIPAQQR